MRTRLLLATFVFGSIFPGCSTLPPTVAPVAPAPTAPGRFHTEVNAALAPKLGMATLVCSPAKADFRLINLPLTHGEAGAAGAGRVQESLRHSSGDLGGTAILLPAVIGLGAAGGWIQGAFSGMNAEDVQRAAATLARAGAEFPLVERLASAILARTNDYPVKSLTLHTGWFPAEIPQPKTRLRVGADGVLGPALVAPPAHPVAKQGVDTFVVVRVLNHALCGVGNKNPPLELFLQVKVTLRRTRDWSEAGEFIVSYDSAPRSLMEWSHTDGQPLRDEWEIAVRGLARRVTDILAQPSS